MKIHRLSRGWELFLKRFLPVCTASLITLLIGCGGSSDPGGPGLKSAQPLPAVAITDITSTMVAKGSDSLTFSSSLGGFDTVTAGLQAQSTAPPSLTTLWQQLQQQFPASSAPGAYVYTPYKITFVRGNGAPPETGLLVVPWGTKGETFPLLSLQHPTQVERRYSPSKADMDDNELTVHLALLLASSGWIVSVPDYPGMGDNYEVHPYCVSTLGNSVAGMIKADLQVTNPNVGMDHLPWNGQTFLMGFSEGGYATMAAAKVIQTSFPRTQSGGHCRFGRSLLTIRHHA